MLGMISMAVMGLLFCVSVMAEGDKGVRLVGAPAQVELKCMQKFPTTTFLAKTEGNEVVLTVIHHNGTQYMPIHEGIIVPGDLNYMSEKAQLIMKMGDRQEFRFPLNKCKVYKNNIFSCSSGNTKKFQDIEVTATSFNSSLMTAQFLDSTTEYVKLSLNFNISGYVPRQEMTNNFYPSECQFNF